MPDSGGHDAGGTDATVADGGTDAGAVDAGASVRPECEGLNPESCLLPWPSTRYLVADSTTATTRRIQIPVAAMPVNHDGVSIDPTQLNDWNGYTGNTTFMTIHQGMIDDSVLHDWQHIDHSLDMDSPTVLLDVTDLAHPVRVAHWAELDKHGDVLATSRPMYIRPASRLPENHHFVVAIRGLHEMDGTPVLPYPQFKALRDNTPDPIVDARRARFDTEVFAPLTAAGVDRTTLIEAWDMWTATDDMATGDLVQMRDDALMRVGATGLGCSIVSMEEPTVADNAHIFRIVEGTVTVPLYLMSEMPGAGATMRRDAAGHPMAMGTTEVPFRLEIPRSVQTSVAAGGAPVRLIQYGHGLFGDRTEVTDGYMAQFTDDFPSVAVATDWWGMSSPDETYVASEVLPDISKFPTFVDRQVQGIVNFLVVVRTLKGMCAGNAAFQVAGHPTFDPTRVYYHGNSQGGIFGLTVAAMSTDIDHFAIGVGAASYSVFMPRSIDFAMFSAILNAWYGSARNPVDRYVILAVLAQAWERSDPSAFTAHTLSNVLPGSPTGKRMLFQVGRGDAQVHNVGSDLAARNLGIPFYSPSTYPEYGLTPFTDVSDSGYVMYDVGAAPVPDDCRYTTSPEPENAMHNSVHEAVRRDPRAQMQMDMFFTPGGRVHNTCGTTTCAPTPAELGP